MVSSVSHFLAPSSEKWLGVDLGKDEGGQLHYTHFVASADNETCLLLNMSCGCYSLTSRLGENSTFPCQARFNR
jgi:hypothetical protein